MLLEKQLEVLAYGLGLAAHMLCFEHRRRDSHDDLDKLISMKHLLAAFLVLVSADDCLREAFHEVCFIDQLRLHQAALLGPAREIFDCNSWISM